MNPRILTAFVLTLLASTAYARFAKFVHVAPGIESDRPSMPYAISTNPVLTIARSGPNTFTVTIPLKGTRQHQQYWLIRCHSRVDKGQMNFREYVWGISKRNDIEKSERIQIEPDQESLTLEIRAEEMDRTYVYRDYPQRGVMDGGYYYCFDLPAYHKKLQAEQAGAGQPATRPESKSEGGDKSLPEAEGRSR